MELIVKGEPHEIALLFRSIKGIISNDTFPDNLNPHISPEIKYIIDTKAVDELTQLAHTKRKDEDL